LLARLEWDSTSLRGQLIHSQLACDISVLALCMTLDMLTLWPVIFLEYKSHDQ